LKQAAGRRAWLAALFILSSPAFGQQPESLAERLEGCAACHGANGNSEMSGVPSIAGHPKLFLETQLVLIREGLRGTAVMQKVVRGLSDREIIAIATHFAALPARATPGKTDAALIKRGRQLAGKLRCGICHLEDFRGQQQIPRLAGQREEYLVSTMIAFRDNPPPGVDTQMSAVLYGVSDADIATMAYFLSRFR
jgi:cytochrome c553